MKLLFENWRGYLQEEPRTDEDWKRDLRRWEELLFAIKGEEGYIGGPLATAEEGGDPYIEVNDLEKLLFGDPMSPWYNSKNRKAMRDRAETEGTSIPPLDDE